MRPQILPLHKDIETSAPESMSFIIIDVHTDCRWGLTDCTKFNGHGKKKRLTVPPRDKNTPQSTYVHVLHVVDLDLHVDLDLPPHQSGIWKTDTRLPGFLDGGGGQTENVVGNAASSTT